MLLRPFKVQEWFKVFRQHDLIIDRVNGVLLDWAKLAAAICMVADHYNLILLDDRVPVLRLFGWMAFPLFCFALACHLIRGINIQKYVSQLIFSGC